MKIVLDVNIYISSFFWGGNPKAIIERIIFGADELFISKDILNEIECVVNRPKFHAEKDMINYFLSSIEDIGNIITPLDVIKNGSRDKKDNKYLECAIAANAEFVISGDIHLLELKKFGKINIVSAKEYLDLVNR